ncbi:MAG: hypothetical protein QXW41_09120 [Fervidicoccaceae archaeon]
MGSLRRGLSEAVVIMIVILIAVVLGFGIKAWYDTQMNKLPATDLATAEYSATLSSGRWIVSLRVNSNMVRPVAVDRVRVVMSDGTVLEFSSLTTAYVSGTTTYTATVTPPVTRTITGAKSSESFVVVIPVPSPTITITTIEVLVRDTVSGSTQWIKAVGGMSI